MKIKNLLNMLLVSSLMIFFIACEDKEVEKSKRKIFNHKKQSSYMVNKANISKDNNKTLSDVIEDDGIVVDGARDEELLDAFGLAVSQVMVEDGVSVPDCTALAKTEYLTKAECDDISQRYFGFYEILDDGKVKKIDDIFSNGIAGSEIKIEEDQVEYFDSSGNPLLNNLVEFEEFVDSTDDIDILKQLKSTIPNDKTNLKDKINDKLEFLEEKSNFLVDKTKIIEIIKENIKVNPDVIGIVETNEEDQASKEEYDNLLVELNSKSTELANLIITHKNTEMEHNRYPNNEKIINRYNDEVQRISILESEVESLRSQLSSGN